MKEIDTLMQNAVSEKIFPGGVLLAAESSSIRFFKVYGYADIFSKRKMTVDTIFDLASLTKPLATTLALIKLIQEKKLKLDQRLGSVIQEFGKTDKKDITIKQLLYHTSGLPDYVPYYTRLTGDTFEHKKLELRRLLLQEPLKNLPGKAVLYSDLGFMILNWVVERSTGMHLDQYIEEKVYRCLDLSGKSGLFFVDLNKGVDGLESFAATEYCPWRNKLVKGVVHDENAYAVGGIEGHAGLFGTAKSVYNLLSALMSIYDKNDAPGLFSRDILRHFLTRDDQCGRTLGFDTPAPVNSSAGHYFSKKTVGHLGFTGTSFWMDLESGIIIILLTNRIHPSRKNERIREFRPMIHDRVMEHLFRTSY